MQLHRSKGLQHLTLGTVSIFIYYCLKCASARLLARSSKHFSCLRTLCGHSAFTTFFVVLFIVLRLCCSCGYACKILLSFSYLSICVWSRPFVLFWHAKYMYVCSCCMCTSTSLNSLTFQWFMLSDHTKVLHVSRSAYSFGTHGLSFF